MDELLPDFVQLRSLRRDPFNPSLGREVAARCLDADTCGGFYAARDTWAQAEQAGLEHVAAMHAGQV